LYLFEKLHADENSDRVEGGVSLYLKNVSNLPRSMTIDLYNHFEDIL
jgi:hypothetical protein